MLFQYLYIIINYIYILLFGFLLFFVVIYISHLDFFSFFFLLFKQLDAIYDFLDFFVAFLA